MIAFKDIRVVNVQWRHHPIEKSTWEVNSNVCSGYPQVLTDLGFFLTLLQGKTRFFVVDGVVTLVYEFSISICFDYFTLPRSCYILILRFGRGWYYPIGN